MSTTPNLTKDEIKKEVQKLMQAFTAQKFTAFVYIAGITDTGVSFSYQLRIDNNDEEFKKFLNDYGATLSSQLL